MTDHEDRPERSPTTAKDARSDAELDAIAEAEVEGLPVSTDAAFRTPRAKGRFAAAIDAVLPRDASATNGTSWAAPGRT